MRARAGARRGRRAAGTGAAVLAAALVLSGGNRPVAAQGPPRTAPAPPAAASAAPGARGFSIARLKYGGGGDWYGNQSSIQNLLRAVKARTTIPVASEKEAVIEPGSAALFQHPFVFASGHGNMKFSDSEIANLRRYLTAGGFLWVDDDFGIGPSLRREVARLFPGDPLVELPWSHPIFHQLYEFPGGLPKIHEHSGGPPQAFAVVQGGRVVLLFTFDTEIGDGLEDEGIHDDPPEKREAATRMALNIVHFALSQ